jgi:hypothetical protein
MPAASVFNRRREKIGPAFPPVITPYNQHPFLRYGIYTPPQTGPLDLSL